MANEKHVPSVLWAQRKDKVYLTINVEDCKSPIIKFDEHKLHFEGIGNKDCLHYELAFEFYGEVDAEKSKFAVLPRHIQLVAFKKESGPFWPRLLKEKTKAHFLKTDFEKWRDEDDSDVDESKDMAFEDMMNDMGSFKGAGDELANEEEDSDDEEMPDLE